MFTLQKTLFLFFILCSHSLFAQEISLQEGDIIGESEIIEDSSTAYIEAATKSRFGHVGVVLAVGDELKIYEEYPPEAQVVSLKEFLGRAPGLFSVIRRNSPLSPAELQMIQAAGDDLIAKKYPYNYTQTRNDSSMNCSEFLNFIFGKAHINVGKIQTIGEMNLKTFGGIPWRLWKLSAPKLSKSDEVITPKSVMQTPNWAPVAGTLNPRDDLSDRDLYLQWKNDKALDGVAHEWFMFQWELKMFSYPFHLFGRTKNL